MQIGYSKRKWLPQIQQKHIRLRKMLEEERQLTEDVQGLNIVLEAQSLTMINGLIFTKQIKSRLANDLFECINKEHRLVSYGFQFWHPSQDQKTKYTFKKLIAPKPTFQSLLKEVSVANVEKYQHEKIKQLQKLRQLKWRVNSTAESRVTDHRLHTEAHSLSFNSTPIKSSKQSDVITKKFKLETEMPEVSQTEEEVKIQEIHKILQKHKNNLVSIWLPPKTYPQFYGVIVPAFSKTMTQIRCRIKKYILYKQSIKRSLFQNMIDFLSLKFNIELKSIEMIMSKAEYRQYFERCGWQMKSWEGIDKICSVFVRQ